MFASLRFNLILSESAHILSRHKQIRTAIGLDRVRITREDSLSVRDIAGEKEEGKVVGHSRYTEKHAIRSNTVGKESQDVN